MLVCLWSVGNATCTPLHGPEATFHGRAASPHPPPRPRHCMTANTQRGIATHQHRTTITITGLAPRRTVALTLSPALATMVPLGMA